MGNSNKPPLRQRKASIRMPDFNYSNDGLYFVTSCLQDRICHFGQVIDGEMRLNEFGQIAHDQWHWMVNRYPYVASHAFVVMPNHIHGVLEINRGFLLELGLKVRIDRMIEKDNRSALDVGKPIDETIKIKPLNQLLGVYKTTSSKLIHLAGLEEFKWQRSYHDHVIRAEDAYERIVAYIQTNPLRWHTDKFNF